MSAFYLASAGSVDALKCGQNLPGPKQSACILKLIDRSLILRGGIEVVEYPRDDEFDVTSDNDLKNSKYE